jgi:hypothetical protein
VDQKLDCQSMNYQTKLWQIRRIARSKDVPFSKIDVSPDPKKKFRIYLNDGTHVDFGARGSITYLEGASEAKRRAYRARHSQIYLKDGKRAIDVKYSPAWLSWNLLW